MSANKRTSGQNAQKLIPAAGYARRSTDMQERSIPDQKAHVEKWAAAHGYRVLRWLIDDAISGTSTKGRAAFERLLHEAENGRDFDAVLCYDIPRFSRGGTYETGYYLHRLKLAGVEVVFTAEGIPEGDEGELVAGVKSWQAKQYSVRLSRDCIRGTISHIMQKRCAPGGKPPYGYDKQHCTAAGQILRTFRWLPDGRKQEYGPDGKLIRVLAADETVKKAKSDVVRYIASAPDRVAVVKRIFEQCAAGYGYHYIAARLNEDGVASSTGVPWNANEIRRMLENPAYRGAVAWNRRTLGKLYGVAGDGSLRTKRSRGDRRNAEEDWFVVEDAHEPLVTPALFRCARAAVAGRRDQGGLARPTNRSLLSGLIVCGHCRQNFLQKHVNSLSGGKPVRYRYYTDGGYNRGGKTVCALTNIPADALDRWVVEKVRYVLLGDHAGVDVAVDAFVRAVRSRAGHDGGGNALAGVEHELDAINRRIKATVAMIADPTFDGLDELKQTLADLKARRDALQARLTDARGATTTPLAERELRAWATDRFRRFDQLCDPRRATPEARNLIHAYVDRIEIDPHARQGVLYLPANAFACLQRDFSTRLTLEDPRVGTQPADLLNSPAAPALDERTAAPAPSQAQTSPNAANIPARNRTRETPPLPSGRRLHRGPLPRQSARRRPRRRRPLRGDDAALHQLDQPLRGDVSAAADACGPPGRGRLPRPHLLPRTRAALRRPSHPRHLPRLAERRRRPARRTHRPGMRRRPRTNPPRRPAARLRRTAAAPHRAAAGV